MKSPFQDWKEHGSIPDAVLKHEACCEDSWDIVMYLVPGQKTGYMEYYAEFVVWHFKLWLELDFDEDKKIVQITRLFCERENYWRDNELNAPIKSGTGGIEFYQKNLANLSDNIGLDNFVSCFFGTQWTAVQAIAEKEPHNMREACADLVKRCRFA